MEKGIVDNGGNKRKAEYVQRIVEGLSRIRQDLVKAAPEESKAPEPSIEDGEFDYGFNIQGDYVKQRHIVDL